MRNRLFLALIICLSVFVCGAHASDSAINVVPPPPEVLFKEAVRTSDDISVNLTEKNVIPPKIPSSTTLPLPSNKKSIASTDKTNSTMPKLKAAAATGPGTGPNTAPYFEVGGIYQDALAATGAQHWFYTQADRNGQMTVHLDVPATTAVDYDLYVYRYEPSTGNLYTFQSSTRNPGAAEHISFTTTTGSYYFIHINSYQGGGSSMYYRLHIEMAALTGDSRDVGEVDDFPDNARTISLRLNDLVSATGRLSMRNDEDFLKFTAVGTASIIDFSPINTNILVDLYVLNGTALNYMVTLPGTGSYPVSMRTGTTYYFHVHHADNTKAFSTSDYTLKVTSFNCSTPLTDVTFLGRNISGSQVLYIASNKLYMNSDFIMGGAGGVEPLCVYDFAEPNSTFRQAVHHSHAAAPVGAAIPISYTVYGSGSGVSSMSNALAIYIRRDGNHLGVKYENWKTSYQNPNTGETLKNPSRFYQSGYAVDATSAFILDLSDKKIKDFASPSGNGFYNRYFDTHSFLITPK